MNTNQSRPGPTAPRVLSLSGAPRAECVITLATARTRFSERLSRLHQSLVETGFAGDLLAWTPERFPDGCPSHQEVPFAFKPFCFAQARPERRLALWMDASCVAIRPLDALFEHIATHGYLLFENGRHKVGEWASDVALECLAMSRDEAVGIHEVNAAVIGLDLSSPIANRFLDLWHAAARDGLPFRGVPEPLDTPEDYAAVKWNRGGRVSSDPRVRGHRHDQTIAGILANRLGMTLTPGGLQAYPREGSRAIREDTLIVIDRYGIHPCPAEPSPFLDQKEELVTHEGTPSPDDQRSWADAATLEHLIVVPRGGLGNGLRAVAAARRLCSLIGAKLTVVWEFGNYEALVALDPGMEVLDRIPPYAASVRHIKMPNKAQGGNNENRRVPVQEDHTIIVESWFWFCAAEEPLVTEADALAEWLPRPAEAIQDTVREFTEANFGRMVGMHIRQGDNGRKLVLTPIEDFLREAERVVGEGYGIFLATDSQETERMMRDRFGDRVIVFPKTWELPFRWPRLTADGEKLAPDLLEKQIRTGATEAPPDFVDEELLAAGAELVPDFVDMQLLAACEYVIGSAISSYSQMAARYNGSSRCLMLPAPPLHPVWGRGLEPAQKMRKRTLMRPESAGSSRNGRPRVRRNDYSTLVVPELGRWEPKLTVSVVIPAYGNQEKLDLTLAALAAQTYPSHLMQVVVVDDGSSPPLRLPEIAPADTRMISSGGDGWGAGHAMRAGVRAADGDVIHRLDSDMLVYRDHIEANMRWHHVADYLVVIGYKRFVDFSPGRQSPENVYDAVSSDAADGLYDLERSHPSWIETVIDETDGLRAADGRAYTVGTGQTISLTRSLYDDCEVDIALVRGQDTEFSYRAAQAGAVFVPEPEARAFHLGLTEMMTRYAEGTRFREPYLSNRVPLRRDRREETGRQWLVPYVDVVVDVGGATYEEVRATVEGALASGTDIRVTLVGPWSGVTDDRHSTLDDPLLDLRLARESFVHDGRVKLVESVPPTSAPVPFRFTCPAGWVVTADALHRLIDIADGRRHGMVLLTLPRGSRTSAGRLERTAAVARALRLRDDGEPLEEVVDEIFGTHRIDGTEWAMVPASERTRPPSAATLHGQLRAYQAEAARWQKESEHWERKATRLKRRLQEPLSKKLLQAARKRITPW